MNHIALTIDGVQPADMPQVAAIFVSSFRPIVARRFRRDRHALAFYHDLFELMRRTHGDTFLAARLNGRMVGYLLLTWPGRSLWPALARGLHGLKLGARALTGRYGFMPRLFADSLRQLTAGAPPGAEWQNAPCVYAVAVAGDQTGRGIGRRLMDEARARAGARGLWLYVQRDNTAALQFYQRSGLEIVATAGEQHVMVWRARPGAT